MTQIQGALLEDVVAITRDAGALIMEIYRSDFEVRGKQDASPVTEADEKAEQLILERLGALKSQFPVVSEEAAAAGYMPELGQCFWLVDPLDGTKEFIQRNGEFTVNIALIEDGVATFGVIQQPVTARLWYGTAGQGAYRREAGQERAIRVQAPASVPLRVAVSRSHRDARTLEMLEKLPAHIEMNCGSSLKFCSIAEGALDFYPRFGRTSEWDTAAGQIILEAAGGALRDLQGRPFRYNQRDTLLNGDFLAVGDVALFDQLPPL